ncbi:MAG: hypothetical protein EOM40_09105 [Clostridia bacterium]|nr:hypothetical protein [Clostridia bacterium]NCC42208.1 hypothetical protein [Clostridia bacterium]
MRSGGSDEPETADASVDDAQAENTQEIAANESTPGADGASSEGGTSAQDGDAVKENTGSATGGAASSESGTGTQAGSQNGTQAEAQTDPSVTPSDAPEGTGEATAQTDAAVVPTLNFTEDSVMLWPVSGEVLIDYSMDATTYFTTLDQYKYNSALILGSSAGEPIQATANGQIVSISENEETGVTLTMDLGNGYQAVYGQLKDLAVAEGQTVESGTILGYVSEPTKYYVKEGANLYFGMTKDGNPVDPMIYIETVTE